MGWHAGPGGAGRLIPSYRLEEWSTSNVVEQVDPVPATMNLDIAKRAIELMGPENTMVMTERCDSARLGGQYLHTETENTLWDQEDGIVSAGSQPLSRQVHNLRGVDFEDRTIWQLLAGTPHRVFGLSASAEPVSTGAVGHE